MIIFYDKSDGRIVGSINGRSHTKQESNMWVGKQGETDRIFYLPGMPLFEFIEKDPKFIQKYKVDITKLVVVPIAV